MHLFNYKKLRIVLFDDVYEPAEDSFMLAKHTSRLKGRILEIGCGTGIVSINNAKLNPRNRVLAVDINKRAIENTGYNSKINKIKNIRTIQSNLFSKVRGKFDHIFFNPPYLPTMQEEKLKTKLNFAYDGGKYGRKTIDRFLKSFGQHLKKSGSAFLIHSSLNNLKKTESVANKKGFLMRIIDTESFFFEKIYLLQLSKRSREL